MLHLIKLAVGAESLQDLSDWQTQRWKAQQAAGQPPRLTHTTRMVPKRVDELLAGGSIFWVIKGFVLGRQRLQGIEPFRDGEGIARCHLVYDRLLVPVSPRPKRAFQGWRYLEPKEAPPDLPQGAAPLDRDLQQALGELGLL